MVSVFSTDECNSISGTDGAQFPPFRKKKDELRIWSPDLCRHISFVYENETDLNGIPVWRYVFPFNMFGSTATHPENECYCSHYKKHPHRCSVENMFDLGACHSGSPLVVTFPHFLDTEPYLGELINGMSPDREKHESFVLLEPVINL